MGSGVHDRPRAPGPQWSRSTDLDRRGGNLPARGARRAVGSHRPTSGVRAASPYPRSLNRENRCASSPPWEIRLMPGPAPRPVATTEGGAAEMRRGKRRPPQAFCVPRAFGSRLPSRRPRRLPLRRSARMPCGGSGRHRVSSWKTLGRDTGGGVPMPSRRRPPARPLLIEPPALRTRDPAPAVVAASRCASSQRTTRSTCVRGVAVAIPGAATRARAIAQHGHQRAPLIALLSPSQPMRPRMPLCAGAVAGPSAAMRRMPRHSLCAPQQFHSRRQGIGIASR